ncbi:MAG: DUF92 domain-containing protein [Candidatus Thermoplasmatota archaeon]|nr:DUF92 domain-containing protein [Candidatus Thermoplasmatota archaeon]
MLGEIMVEPLAIALMLSTILAFITKKTGVLNTSGVISAFAIGVLIGSMGGTSWLIILLFFLLTSFAATKRNFKKKEALGVQEGKKGERGWKNAWAAGLIPALIAVFAYLDTPLLPREVSGVVFVTAIAAASSDTFASEMGMLYREPVLITNPWKRVPVGTNGGITAMGTLWSLIASAMVALSALPLLVLIPGPVTVPSPAIPDTLFWMLVATFLGFAGCQFDSIFGSMFENKGKMGKYSVNLLSAGLATMIAWFLVLEIAVW